MLLFGRETSGYDSNHNLVLEGFFFAHTHDNISLVTGSQFLTVTCLLLDILIDFSHFVHGDLLFSIEDKQEDILSTSDSIIIEQRRF